MKQASCSSCTKRSSPALSNSINARPRFFRCFSHAVKGLFASRDLICIGYRCGGAHINQILREWLEFTGERQLELVRPGTKICPAFLNHVAGQVVLRDGFATDYLERYAITPHTIWERAAKADL
jgi:hypothetical protein